MANNPKQIRFRDDVEFKQWLMDNEGNELYDGYNRSWVYIDGDFFTSTLAGYWISGIQDLTISFTFLYEPVARN